MVSRTVILIISFGFWLVWQIRRSIGRALGQELPGTCVILYYHGITSQQRGRFARQMDELLRWAKPVPADAKNILTPGVHHAAVTFDDGFQCVAANALPELIKRHIPSTIFIPTGYIGREARWSDEPGRTADHVVMTAKQLLELPADWVAIGSHTVTHPDLRTLKNEEAQWELSESRMSLEHMLGQRVKLLSFPYGKYHQPLVEWSRQAGYDRVFTIVPALAYAHPDEYETGRVAVEPTDWLWEFRLKLCGAYQWLPLAFATKSKLRAWIRKSLTSTGPSSAFAALAGQTAFVTTKVAREAIRSGKTVDLIREAPETRLAHSISLRRATAPDFRAEVDQIDKAEWSRVLPDFEDAMVYQTWSYGEIRWGGRNLSHLVLKRNGEIVALSQARILTLPVVKHGIAYVAWGPVWRRRGQKHDPEILRQMVDALKQEYAVRRGLHLRVLPNEVDGTINPHAAALHAIFADEGFSRKPTPSRTLLLDVTPPWDELRKNLTQRWRNHLNVAEKKGLNLIEGTGDDLFEIFLVLYREILKRKRFLPGADVNEFRKIQRDLPDPLKLKIILCELRGEPVAAAVGSLVGDTGIVMFSAVGNKGMKSNGSYLLRWRMIEWLKGSQARWLDLGGINPEKNPGSYHFKAGLAGKAGQDVYLAGQFDICESLFSSALVQAGDRLRASLEKLKPAIDRAFRTSTNKIQDRSLQDKFA